MSHPPPNRYCGWDERCGRVQGFVLRSVFFPGYIALLPRHCADAIRCHAGLFGIVAGIGRQEIAELKAVLARYPVEELGPWTWVLVRSQDWIPISVLLGLKPESPAFTAVDQRETFLEEALFKREGLRSAELQREWLMPREQLLDLAVTHELGHALCSEPNEALADHFGEELRRGHRAAARPRCAATRQSARQRQPKGKSSVSVTTSGNKFPVR